MKKILLASLGAITTAIPVATIVSCSAKKSIENNPLPFITNDKIENLQKISLTTEQQLLLNKYMVDTHEYKDKNFDDFVNATPQPRNEDQFEKNSRYSLFRQNGNFVIGTDLTHLKEGMETNIGQMFKLTAEAINEIYTKSIQNLFKVFDDIQKTSGQAPEVIKAIFKQNGYDKYAELLDAEENNYSSSDFFQASGQGVTLSLFQVIDSKGLNSASYFQGKTIDYKMDWFEYIAWFNKTQSIITNKIKAELPAYLEQNHISYTDEEITHSFNKLLETPEAEQFNLEILEGITKYHSTSK